MTDVYNMKSVFSCSDFLSDLWQGGPDDAVPLDGLACPSEGGSTQLGRGKSADLLHLLGQTEEANSDMRTLQSLTASSSTKQQSLGIVNLARIEAWNSVYQVRRATCRAAVSLMACICLRMHFIFTPLELLTLRSNMKSAIFSWQVVRHTLGSPLKAVCCMVLCQCLRACCLSHSSHSRPQQAFPNLKDRPPSCSPSPQPQVDR